MAAYTLHIALNADSDAEAVEVAGALRRLADNLHLTDADDWAEHVGLECAWFGEPASHQALRDGPRVVVEVPTCSPELVSVGLGRRVCLAHARAHEQARTASQRITP